MRYYQKCISCGGEAYEYKTRPVAGQAVSNQNVTHDVEDGTTIVCTKCGKEIPQATLNDNYLIVK